MSEDQHDDNATVSEVSGQRPAMRFSGSGNIAVAVWKSKTDDGHDRYSVRIDRSYKTADGKYESTSYLRDNDLLRTQQLLGQADAWIEQDKSKSRAAASTPQR